MNDVFSRAKDVPLFRHIAHDDIKKMLECLPFKKVSYKKDDIILKSGDSMDFIGLLIDGSVSTLNEDHNGNINITSSYSAPSLLGVVTNGAELGYSLTTAIALDDCEILMINYTELITPCPSKCDFHIQIIRNLLFSASTTAITMYYKTTILTKPTIREKVMCFLNQISERHGMQKKFTIPYNRNEMAQYLCVNQSALSNELRKMRDDGLIRFKLNKFELL